MNHLQLSGQLTLAPPGAQTGYYQSALLCWNAAEFMRFYIKTQKTPWAWTLSITWFTVCHHHSQFILCCCQQVVRLHVTERDLTSQVKGVNNTRVKSLYPSHGSGTVQWVHSQWMSTGRCNWWKCASTTDYNHHTFSINTNTLVEITNIFWGDFVSMNWCFGIWEEIKYSQKRKLNSFNSW